MVEDIWLKKILLTPEPHARPCHSLNDVEDPPRRGSALKLIVLQCRIQDVTLKLHEHEPGAGM